MEQVLLDHEQITQLKSLIVNKICRAADEGNLIDVPYLPFVLDKWYHWCEDHKTCEEWVVSIIENDDLLLKILEQFRDPVYSSDEIFIRIDPTDCAPYINPSKVYDRVCDLESKLDGHFSIAPVQKETIVLFKKSYLALENRNNEGN